MEAVELREPRDRCPLLEKLDQRFILSMSIANFMRICDAREWTSIREIARQYPGLGATYGDPATAVESPRSRGSKSGRRRR